MNDTRYKIILYIIIAVITGTIGIQVYWNYKNYGINKQQLVNEVQASLDNAVEDYYANLTRSGFITLTSPDSVNSNKIDKNRPHNKHLIVSV